MKKQNLLLFLYFITFCQFIKCESDCSSCEINEKKCNNCDTNCHWFKIDTNTEKCLSCQDKENEESKYYSKKTTIDGNHYCHKIGKTGIFIGKLIMGTNQIVIDCQNFGYYQLGDICYDECPENSQDLNKNKICVCNNFYSKTIKDGLIYINCEETCPIEYPLYDGVTKECLKKCPKGKPYLGINIVNPNSYECRATCSKKKYIKKISEGITITYCYEECPLELSYFYNDNTCVDKCNKNKYDIISLNNKCVNLINVKKEDCGSTFYITIDPLSGKYACKSGTSCPQDYPFKYIKNEIIYCLLSCDDTDITFLNNTKTFLNIRGNQCLEVNDENNGKYFKNEEEKRYIQDCLLDITGPFHYNKKCVKSCEDKFILDETNECVDFCDTSKYYIDEITKMCVKQCPTNLGRGFYYEETKKCTPCLISGNEGEIGFHKEGDKICYLKCPDNYKHIFNNNICFEGNCKDTDYKFSSR